MRTRDIMTSPVVTGPPDAQLKAVAALLVERGINVVPVVGAGDLGRQLVVGLARTVPGVVDVRSGDGKDRVDR
jgi:CBS domain-containing protein